MINDMPSNKFDMFLNEPGLLMNQQQLNGNLGLGNNFMSSNGLPVYIVALGDLPVATADVATPQYPWMVLTGPLATNFVILARDVQLFESQYKDQVISILQTKGFSSSPVKIFQSESECNYPVMGTIIPSLPIVPPNAVPIGARGTGKAVTPKTGSTHTKPTDNKPKTAAPKGAEPKPVEPKGPKRA